jgi:peptide/nickel transport system substrate-binding protein
VNYVTFSFTHAPFTNPLAREAVFEATDSESIRVNLYDNFYPAAEGPIPPAEEGYLKTVQGYPGYNLSAATALVSQLGGLKFTLFEGNTTAAIQEGEALQAMWAQAGMTVALNPLASGALIAADHAHTYDALLITFPATSQPDQLLYRFFYSGSPISQGGMVDLTLDSLILKARASFSAKTQTALYQQIDTRLEAVDYTNDVIYSSTYYYAYNKQVQDFSSNPFSLIQWQLVWLK